MTDPDTGNRLDHQEIQTLWWKLLTYFVKMFPLLPQPVTIIIYCCIVTCAIICLFACMWLCSSCFAKRAKRKKNDKYKNRSIWTVAGHRMDKESAKGCKESSRVQEKPREKFDTLQHLERMPWWDRVEDNSSVNWHDYYRMAEGKNRSRTGERKRYPWKTNGISKDSNRKRIRLLQSEEDNSRRQLVDVDSCWENVQPRNVDASGYWQHMPARKDTTYFPQFRMIPRASWSNQNLLGYIGPTGYCNIDYGNRSLTSLTSTDMQIMQMVAKRQKNVRPARKDVFYRQSSKSDRQKANRRKSRKNAHMHHVSPHQAQNQKIAHKQARRSFSADYQAHWPETSSSRPRSLRNVNVNNFRNEEDCLPPPPGYPPPPTPRNEGHSTVSRPNDTEL